MADRAGGAANIEDCRRLLIGQNPIEYCCNTEDGCNKLESKSFLLK